MVSSSIEPAIGNSSACRHGASGDEALSRPDHSNQQARRAPKAVAALALTAIWLAACATNSCGSSRACLKLEASPSLNLHNGQPHATVLYLYPLENRLDFEQMPVTDLLAGASPAGLMGSRSQLTVAPGEQRDVDLKLPQGTDQLGLVADFYRAPGDAEGIRKAIVNARCGLRSPRLVLSPVVEIPAVEPRRRIRETPCHRLGKDLTGCGLVEDHALPLRVLGDSPNDLSGMFRDEKPLGGRARDPKAAGTSYDRNLRGVHRASNEHSTDQPDSFLASNAFVVTTTVCC